MVDSAMAKRWKCGEYLYGSTEYCTSTVQVGRLLIRADGSSGGADGAP
jgi:hypothetical protein